MPLRAFAALLTLLVLGCGFAPSPPAAAALAGGCGTGILQHAGETTAARLNSGGLDREYRVHAPSAGRSGRRLPLVLAFHGRGERPELLEKDSGLDGLDSLVVYPLGTRGAGGAIGWEGAPYSSDADDVQFTNNLIDQLERDYCVDPGRVYATGMSNGGGFAGLLACRMAGRIAAITPVSAAFYEQSQQPCDPARPVPVLNFHGAEDPVAPFDGDSERGLAAQTLWVKAWADRDRCARGPEQFFQKDDVTAQRWEGCAGAAEVVDYVVGEGGHTWPGGAGRDLPGLGKITRTVSATALMGAFFSSHRL